MNKPSTPETGFDSIGFVTLSKWQEKEEKYRSDLHLHSAYINQFYLTPPQLLTLQSHFLLHWTGPYLQRRISIHGTIIYQDIEYICVLPDCVKEKFFQSLDLKLSFRNPKAGYGLYPYVLVRFGEKS